MVSWVVVPLGTAFPTQFTKSLIDYIVGKYSLADPLKTDTTNMIFREGFFTTNKPYEITTLEQNTEVDQILHSRDQTMWTLMYINLRMYRLNPQGVDPQLWNMREEIIRIIGEYQKYDIAGISEIRYQGGFPIYLSNSDRDAGIEQDWRYVIKATLHYELRNIAP
jgi:hypothetical protein